jgi:hypothetical protein
VEDMETLERLCLYSIKSESHENFVIIFTTVKERKCGRSHGILRKQRIQKESKEIGFSILKYF